MGLKIIGPGFGRTGTDSLREALELLGYGRCHHMYEVLQDPEQIDHWVAISKGETRDFADVFDGFTSQVDWPGANYWREASQIYPDAKVVLSVRPPEKWFKSFDGTIGKLLQVYTDLDIPPHVRDVLDMNVRLIGNGVFGGNWRDKDTAIAAFHQRVAEVKAEIPAERLLVFDVAEGWEPLCEFLGADIPDTPFPHKNLRAAFWDVVGGEPPD